VVQEDSTPEQRRDEKREAQQYIYTRAYDNWRASPDAGRRIEHLLNEGSQHWSTTLPAHPALKMSDAAVKVGAGTMFGIAYNVTPSDGCPNRASLARAEVFSHVLTCATCAARFRYHRHDAILHVMKKVAEEYGVLCSLSYKQTHGIAYDQQQPDIMVCRNGDLPIHIDFAVAQCRRDARQDTLLTRTLHKEGKYTDFDNGIGAHGFFLPTTAAINKKNDRLLKQIADVTTKRDLYRQMRNQITTALLNLTGNGLTWVPRL
jgi:hypothetical protein